MQTSSFDKGDCVNENHESQRPRHIVTLILEHLGQIMPLETGNPRKV